MNRLSFKTYYGETIREIISQLGELRPIVFNDFPYLYVGDPENEKEYLEVYTTNRLSIAHLVFDGNKLVGAATGMPLESASGEIRQPFIERGFDLQKIFYFGESVLLEEYRGKGLGNEFYNVREKHAVENGFSMTTFCAVVRPEDHELRPVDYRSNDAFWLKRGYEQLNFSCEMSWVDKGHSSESVKQLQFWSREWK